MRTLGELAGLPRIAVADRFGALGLRAHDLASGRDTPLRPRRPHEELIQAIGLPEAAYGTQLERALDLLIERLVADPRRTAARSARCGWRPASPAAAAGRAEVGAPQRLDSPERLRLALAPKLGGLAAPATSSPCGPRARPRRAGCSRRSPTTRPRRGREASARRCGRYGRRPDATRSCGFSRSTRLAGAGALGDAGAGERG